MNLFGARILQWNLSIKIFIEKSETAIKMLSLFVKSIKMYSTI